MTHQFIIAYAIGIVLNLAMTIKMHKSLKEYWDSNSHMVWIYATCFISWVATIPILVCFLIGEDDEREIRNKSMGLSDHQKLVNEITRK